MTIHGDPVFQGYDGVAAATEEDYAREYLTLHIAASVVPDLDAALAHIRRHSSARTATPPWHGTVGCGPCRSCP